MKKIKSKAFSLLARKSYFSKELAGKLKEKGYEEKEIAPLIQSLQKDGWLDDQELAKRYIAQKKRKGYGAKVIAYELKQKGGELSIAIDDEEEVLRAFVEKRYLKDLPEKREKVIGALMRRGFSYELIDRVLAHFLVCPTE